MGSRLPYYATSLGKALVAWLPAGERRRIWESADVEAFTEHTITDFEKLEVNFDECRRKGYAEGKDELEVGLRSISLPIFNKNNEPIAAINISTNSMRTSDETIKKEFLPLLTTGAEELNRLMKNFS